MKIIKKVINNIPVTYIKTDKFKSVAGTLYFKSLTSLEKRTKMVLLRNIMINNCKKFDTNEKLNLNCLEKYDANYSSSTSFDGNYSTISFSFNVVDDKYLEEENNEKVIDTFNEIVFNPNVTNKAFDKETFDLCYKRFEESIKRKKEYPASYCFDNLKELMDNEKPYSFIPRLDILKKQTPSTIYYEYEDLMNNSEVSLYLVGDFDYEAIADKITKNIKNSKKFNDDIFILNDIKNELVEKEEGLNTSESVLAYGLKCTDLTDFEKFYVMPIYSNILGGGATSRCFNEIRENNSLAYYCNSSYKILSGLLIIYGGIKKDNYKKTKDLMIKLQESMGNVTLNELNIAKKDIISYLKQIEDDYNDLISFNYHKDLYNSDDVKTRIKNFEKVSKDDIKKVHQKIHKDSIFFVRGDK